MGGRRPSGARGTTKTSASQSRRGENSTPTGAEIASPSPFTRRYDESVAAERERQSLVIPRRRRHDNQLPGNCLSFGGLALDHAAEDALFAVVAPGAIDAAVTAVADARLQQTERETHA